MLVVPPRGYGTPHPPKRVTPPFEVLEHHTPHNKVPKRDPPNGGQADIISLYDTNLSPPYNSLPCSTFVDGV